METNWLSSDFKQDRVILAGDIGGTNTTLAVVGKNKSKYTLILKCAFKSQQIDGLTDPIKEVIATARQKSSALKIDLCCISAAGPVENNHCQMTNCKWAIDGKALKKTAKVDTLVINDFLAVGYGIPTLEVNDPKQITRLRIVYLQGGNAIADRQKIVPGCPPWPFSSRLCRQWPICSWSSGNDCSHRPAALMQHRSILGPTLCRAVAMTSLIGSVSPSICCDLKAHFRMSVYLDLFFPTTARSYWCRQYPPPELPGPA